jgi:hypothetical protein
VAGAIAIGVFLSVWLLAFSMFTFFALAAAKRLGELSDADAAGRTVTRRGYTVEDRRILSQMAMSAGYVGVLVLALYIDEPAVQERFGAHRLFWGVCALLIFWISRLVLVANRGEMDDDPLIWALKDPVSRATVAIVAALSRAPYCCDTPGADPALRGLRRAGGGGEPRHATAVLAVRRRSTPRASPWRLPRERWSGSSVKYVLDKRWIFYDDTRARGRRDGSSSSIP